MNEILKIIITLTLVTVIATTLLAMSYGITKPFIDKAKENNFQIQIKKIFPDSDSNRKVDSKFEVYSQNRLLGYAVLAYANGYSSQIELLIGVSTDSKVAGVAVLSQSETPGLGTRITEQVFLQQFVGKSINELTLSKYGGKIDGITGASVSSKAVVDTVKVTVEELHD